MKKIVTMFLMLSLIFGSAATVFADTAKVDDGVNFRSAPSTSSTVYSFLPVGTDLDVISKVNDYWYQVTYNGKVGYVSANYITVIPDKPAWEVKADAIIAEGRKYLGVPYLFGGDYDKDGTYKFDCSGFTKRIFGDNGIYLMRASRYQATQGTEVSVKEMRKGDLIFFKSSAYTTDESVTHVAVYAGRGKILHTYGAPGVTYSDYFYTNWEKRTVVIKRVITE